MSAPTIPKKSTVHTQTLMEETRCRVSSQRARRVWEREERNVLDVSSSKVQPIPPIAVFLARTFLGTLFLALMVAPFTRADMLRHIRWKAVLCSNHLTLLPTFKEEASDRYTVAEIPLHTAMNILRFLEVQPFSRAPKILSQRLGIDTKMPRTLMDYQPNTTRAGTSQLPRPKIPVIPVTGWKADVPRHLNRVWDTVAQPVV